SISAAESKGDDSVDEALTFPSTSQMRTIIFLIACDLAAESVVRIFVALQSRNSDSGLSRQIAGMEKPQRCSLSHTSKTRGRSDHVLIPFVDRATRSTPFVTSLPVIGAGPRGLCALRH